MVADHTVEGTTGAGGNMVVVKVRETYDLCTVKNKMTLISVHTPKPDIIKRNFPGLLLQCKAYRPLQASVRIACASVQPLDPLGVGTSDGDVAPEDVFNPILYKAMSNVGMSQLEARICAMSSGNISGVDINGKTAAVDVDSNTALTDEFPVYYGLLSNAHGWKHAAPQSGLSMDGLKPLVYEMLYNVGDSTEGQITSVNDTFSAPNSNGNAATYVTYGIRGNAKPLPFMNCTSFTYNANDTSTVAEAGFKGLSSNSVFNSETSVPWINCCVAALVIPPSRLHVLYYRMIVEWDIEFSMIRPLSEILNYSDLSNLGQTTHYQNYNYSNVKAAITGSEDSLLENDTCMVSANVDVKKVM